RGNGRPRGCRRARPVVVGAHGHPPPKIARVRRVDRLGSRGPAAEGGYVVLRVTLTAARRRILRSPIPLQLFTAVAKAGFRRYSTYRQATLAGIFTNSVFGFLRCYVLLAVTAGAGGTVAGYQGAQLVSYVWIGQGMLATIGIWDDLGLAARIRTG